MIDINDIPADVIHARGVYATVRSAHEDAKSSMQQLSGEFTSLTAQALKAITKDDPDVLTATELVATARIKLDRLESMCSEIEQLAKQRKEWKVKAWK